MNIRYKLKTGQSDPALIAFEETLGFKVGYRNAKVPESIGEGTLVSVEVAEGFQANVQSYRLAVPLQVIKEATEEAYESVYIVFYYLEVPETAIIQGMEVDYDQGVNIYAQPINAVLEFPAGTQRNVVCMRIDRKRLGGMLGEDQEKYLDGLLQQDQSFFIHERLSPEMRALLWELRMPPAAKVLQRLFYQVRIQQLVYLLLEQLNQRTAAPHKNSNSVDVARVFKARQMLVHDLSTPPTIAGLARSILMSESQLKQSFREIFGVSIYQYFQNARLEKARQLLAEGGRTVKDVGYELGFTNIGHFSRLFERAYHVKPKKYQLMRE
jgi:AraC-like DNA-binding protein